MKQRPESFVLGQSSDGRPFSNSECGDNDAPREFESELIGRTCSPQSRSDRKRQSGPPLAPQLFQGGFERTPVFAIGGAFGIFVRAQLQR